MGPQETKDERRAIYFGPLFRSSAESGLRGCLARTLADEELPRDGCRTKPYIASRRSQGSIVPFAEITSLRA
ncbi:hypothetical protein WH47_06412 [Habropoda laboriosa]|uniref:Uncharacterized protein n=1 Tax=Habropoda laboriosa TaxID=597456 RepID=A0A0L7RCY6_9HYME|nr:hypothetical protein WH47_06412 [Habropoda laboriosa]